MERETVRPRAGAKSATAFRTISEVSDELEVPQHVLRFWETKFPQVRPLKRGGGRRYYRPEDVALLRRIQRLLYSEGYTIKGVQRLLKDSRSTDIGGEVDIELEGDGEVPSPDLSDSDLEDLESEAERAPEPESHPSAPLPVIASRLEPPSVSAAVPPVPAVVLAATPTAPVPEGIQPKVVAPGALPTWHRRELVAIRAELTEIRALLRKPGR